MESQNQAEVTPDSGKKLRRVLLIRLPSSEPQPAAGAEQTTSQNPPTQSQNSNNTNNDNNEVQEVSLLADPTSKKRRTREGDSNMYKNYSPKQREWMLVYLGYARGLLGMPFEEKLQESVVQQTNSILAKRGRFCNINRIPSSKTLRTVWKNLWEDRTVGSVIRKGGRPRIDPNIKREKRNERERQKRAAAREKREMERSMEIEMQS